MWTNLLALLLFCGCIFADPLYDPKPFKDADMHSHPRDLSMARKASFEEETSEFWSTKAQKLLAEKLEVPINKNIAKNVILFLGDGMSIPTLAASRIYQGQLNNENGEEGALSFERFPFAGLSRTYCVDMQVADSACTATAYLSGVKNNEGTIGVTANVTRRDCDASTYASNKVTSIARWSQMVGKRTGLATTTTVTHASPAGVYAQVANRDWESDSDANGVDTSKCPDIAHQLVYGETGSKLNVVFGGGRTKFLGKSYTDAYGHKGERIDDENLINTWLRQKAEAGGHAEYVYDREGLMKVPKDTEHVLGLFDTGHLPYHLDADEELVPSLAEMTEAAINVLSQSVEGYFLFVEGGKIDHAHHASLAQKSLDETVEFSKAIQKAVDLTNSEDTLIVVTADHAHTMSFSGYPLRGNDILGVADKGSDGLPYTTLTYANGPGYRKEQDGHRHDYSEDDTSSKNFQYPAVAPLGSETHGGDDVGVFALGPWAHLLTGSFEQNLIPHVMAYASCVGQGLTACDG